MTNSEISEIKRIFLSRLDVLDHILDVGAKHLDLEAALQDGPLTRSECVEALHAAGIPAADNRWTYHLLWHTAQLGITCIGLLGRDGGALRQCCDLSIVVPSKVTARIQEAHILIGHTLCGGVEIALGLAA